MTLSYLMQVLNQRKPRSVRIAALLSQPVMPESMYKLLDLLGQSDDRTFAAIGTRLAPGTPLPTPVGVFPRYQVE